MRPPVEAQASMQYGHEKGFFFTFGILERTGVDKNEREGASWMWTQAGIDTLVAERLLRTFALGFDVCQLNVLEMKYVHGRSPN